MAGFPWPLGGVQDWFEGLWNYVSTAAVSAVSIVWNWLTEKVTWLWDTISGAFSSLWTSVSGTFRNLMASLVGAFTDLYTLIFTVIGSLWKSISTGLGSLWTSITGAFSGAIITLTSWFGSMWESLSGAVGAIGNTLSKGITSLGASVSRGLRDLWAGFTEWGSNALGTVSTMFDGAVAGIGKWVSDALAGVAAALGTGLTVFIGWIQEKFNVLTGWLVGGIQALGGALQSVFEGIISMIFAPITQALTPGSPPEPLGEVTRNFGVALMDNIVAEAKKIHESPAQREKAIAAGAAVLGSIGLMHSVGGALTMAFDATHPVKTWGTADLFHRVALNLLSSPVTSAILATPVLIGIITPMRQYFNAMFRPEIPGPGDLIRFVVREVIPPEIFSEYMGYRGYSETISGWFWEAHWVLPAFTQLVDAFHRGIISDGELNTFIIWHDYSPTARPGIGKSDVEIMRGLLKRLIPRVDLRYAWEMGKITDEELEARYTGLGYEEDAALMTEIQMARALVEEIHKVRDEWIRDYLEGYILEDVLRANLAAIGIGAVRIDYYVEYARMRREREHMGDLLDFYKDGYRKDLVTQEVFEDRVYEIIADFEGASLFIEKAYVDKYKKPLPPRDVEAEKIMRDLFKYRVTYIRQLYRTYTIEKPEMISMWIDAGMDPDVAATRADYEELKRPIVKPSPEEIARRKEQLRIQKLEEAKSKVEFRKEIRTAEELLTVLMEIGYSEALATAITQLEIVKALPKPEAG